MEHSGRPCKNLSSNIRETREEVSRLKDELRDLQPYLTDANRLFTTYIALSRQAGFPPNILNTLAYLQQVRITAQSTYRALQMIYGATTLTTLFTGYGGLALAGLMVVDLASDLVMETG